jgi:hypothetical protein
VRDLARRRREHLGDVERVAAGLAVKLARIDLVRRGQLADGLLGERRDREPRHRARRGQLPEHERERVGAVELVVAIAGEDERGHALDLAREQAQHVEGRLVGPMEVLEHEDGRAPAGQLADERTGDLVRPGLARDELLEVAAGHLGDVEQRTERPRGEQAVAGTPEDARRIVALIAERAQQDRLAGARLAAHEDHRPGPGDGHRGERVGQG